MQLKWDGNLIKNVTKDREGYYARIMQYSREHLMLFPYHLSRYVIREKRITPFQYYSQILQDMFISEQSYDQLPNFSAADCLRILGIGRNQYIEKMNQSRSKKSFFVDRRKVTADLMPTIPIDDATIEPWWIVQPGCILQEDIKTITADEKALIDKLFEKGPQKAGLLNLNVLRRVFLRGLVYLDVPIADDDCISVPPLEGFVMNRVLGDYLESLLYKVFVSIDEYTPISELASILQIDLEQVRNAISLFCRLGFAKVKGNEMDAVLMDPSWLAVLPTPSPKKEDEISDNVSNFEGSFTDANESPGGVSRSDSQNDLKDAFRFEEETPTPGSGPARKRIGLLFDSTLTAFLMMGNLSPGLKTHAVTMFEVGKLPDESLDSFLAELEKVVPEEELQGEARRYFDHAVNLREIIKFLRHNPALKEPDPLQPDAPNSGYAVDLLRCESLRSLDKAALDRVLRKSYAVLISLAAMSNESRPVCTLDPPHLGSPTSEAHSLWFKLFIYSLTKHHPPCMLFKRGEIVRSLPHMFYEYDYLRLTPWAHDSSMIPSSIALALINEALRHHSVLVEAVGASSKPEIVHVMFPLDQSETDSPKSFSNHPAVLCLREKLKLDRTVAYVTLMKMNQKRKSRIVERNVSSGSGSEYEPDSQSSYDAEKENRRVVEMEDAAEWALVDCLYGIPVFSERLIRQCCERIVQQKTFSAESFDCLRKANLETSAALLEFIQRNQSQPLTVATSDGLPFLEKNGKEISALPTRSLTMINGLLT